MPMLFVRAAVAVGLLMTQTPASALDPASQPDAPTTVMNAAASFSLGYGAWLMEKRCHQLSPAKGKAFDVLVADTLKRFQDASDEKLFNAVVGAGRDVSSDPKYADCASKDMHGMSEFGLEQVGDANAMLKTLPAGFHLTLTN